MHFFSDEGVVKAVDGVNLDIKRGEVLGLVGESGSGKSTIAHAIMRLVPRPGKIVGGEIILDDEDLVTKSGKDIIEIRGAKISMIFQDPMSSLNPVLRTGEQVAEVFMVHTNLENKSIWQKVIEMFDRVRIPNPAERTHDYPHEFSGGMRQRVMTAMALACTPQLLIADEPTTNLDVTIQAQILDLLDKLRRETGSSVLLITHDLGIIAEMSDRVAILYAGEVKEVADVSTIFENPAHPYTLALLQSIPRLDIEQEDLKVIPGSVPNLVTPPPGCRFHPRCEFVTEKCRHENPPLEEIQNGHLVACWRWREVR